MPKCPKDCNTPKVLEIHNHECPVLFHRVMVPAAMGDDETNPPRNGQYRNVLLVYEANEHVYLFSSDGIPTFISDGRTGGVEDYEELLNKPLINGHELIGDSSLEDIGVTDAIGDALDDYTPTADLSAVALSGDYDDLINKPTIPTVNDATLTIQKNGTNVATFTANSATNTTANIAVPTKTSDLTNDSGFITTSALSGYLPLTGGTLTGKLTGTQIETGTAATNYFQARKFRGEGDASSYYHAIDFGYASHNQVDFYEYGGIWNFWRNLNATATTDTRYLALGITLNALKNKAYTYTFPNKTGTFALTSDLPTVNNGTLTIQKNGTNVQTFTANQSGNVTANITVPTKTSDLTNDGSDGTSTYVEADALATVATSGSYNDLSNKPTIPTVNDATITIQRNSATVDSFTVNASQNKSINIVVPTKTSDLTNDSNFATTSQIPTKTSDLTNDGSDGTSTYVEADDLATVATSGSYNDLSNKPTIGNATLTIQKNGTNVQTFTANATSNKTANITVPTKTSDLTNDSNFVSNTDYATASTGGVVKVGSGLEITNGVLSATGGGVADAVEWDNVLNKPTFSTVATSGSYNDLTDKPTIPTVNNATLTIQKNNTNVATFTANASSNVTANISVPTATSDLTNDSGFITSITKITDAEIDAIMGVS